MSAYDISGDREVIDAINQRVGNIPESKDRRDISLEEAYTKTALCDFIQFKNAMALNLQNTIATDWELSIRLFYSFGGDLILKWSCKPSKRDMREKATM